MTLGGKTVLVVMAPHPMGWVVQGWERGIGDPSNDAANQFMEEHRPGIEEATELFREACVSAAQNIQPVAVRMTPMLEDVNPGAQESIHKSYKEDRASK